MAPSRAFPCMLVLLLAALSVARASDYYSDPTGELKGKFPANFHPREPRSRDGEKIKPPRENVERDMYSDPEGPLKGKFSEKAIERAVLGQEKKPDSFQVVDLLAEGAVEEREKKESDIGWDAQTSLQHAVMKGGSLAKSKSANWGQKWRPSVQSLLKSSIPHLSDVELKALLGPRHFHEEHSKHGIFASTERRVRVERRQLSEADNQKLNLIGVVTQTAAVKAVQNVSQGVPVSIPAGSDGVSLVAVKVSTALLESTGFSFQNVVIPGGVQVPGNPAVVILVFSEFGQNPYGFTNQTVVAPVLGITAYDAADPNAGATNSSLDITPPATTPFQFTFNTSAPGTPLACSTYDQTTGQLVNTTLTTKVQGSSVTCGTTSLGTFTVVSTGAAAPGPAPAPAPAIVAAPPSVTTGPPVASNVTNSSGINGTVPAAAAAAQDSGGGTISGGAIAGIVIGSVAGLAILGLLALLLARRSERSRIARMTQRSRDSEPLTTALIGGQQGFRAPVASHVRTRPGIEGEIYPQ